ncbi:hypothetical protein EVAR_31681_1 [Eumeta japonica]|uniref:Uncharacterized protein n=1 Tax=Eumeta variegata TaxID=151549 RepID=A0A4C1VS34_EUMVA|nr:hypothetical protein EVAR_31681_1 [Eumeta japonica]
MIGSSRKRPRLRASGPWLRFSGGTGRQAKKDTGIDSIIDRHKKTKRYIPCLRERSRRRKADDTNDCIMKLSHNNIQELEDREAEVELFTD